ncbi:MAG: HAD family hydrolase [Paludibacteraceae bacterium]
MKKGYFFDMDGVLFDSMPAHAEAWEEVMSKHHLPFTGEDCYINEGRTGQDVIHEAILQAQHREATEDEIWRIYREKTDAFKRRGPAQPMRGVSEVLRYLQSLEAQIWIVTGSGQQSLFDTIEMHFPGIFSREHMITAFDVVHGKPAPEPYLKAWERSGLSKDECCVIENAPLGIRAGKAAGLFSIGVNTGPLPDSALQAEGADKIFPDMPALLAWLRETND